VAAEERSIKFLLRDEFLHQHGLLHASRSMHAHEVPTEVPDSPIKTPESSLVKCSTSVDVAGPSDKLAPVIEEEEPLGSSHHSQDSGEKAKKSSPVKQSRDDTFEGLSDLFATSQEIFKDDPTTAGISSSVVEATSILQQSSSTQELTLTITPTTTPQIKSGS
jgi:hypothetical protein